MRTNLLDRPEILQVIFHPRPDYGFSPPPGVQHVAVEVEPGVSIGGRLYPAGPQSPAIVYFHGNGEIAADYDEIASLYTRLGITLLVWDYRGYGTSGGRPTVSSLLPDALVAFDATGSLLDQGGLSPVRLYVMGRSLGSAAAVEIAWLRGAQLAGLIIESGFADTFGLLARLGVRVPGADEERDGVGSALKMAQISIPTLIIHGERDILIPPADGRMLYERCASPDKRLVLIPGGGHNDLMMVGMAQYFQAVNEFIAAR